MSPWPAARDFVGSWQASPFLALDTYTQLGEEFGWDIYKAVRLQYHAMAAAGKEPSSNADKIDTYAVS